MQVALCALLCRSPKRWGRWPNPLPIERIASRPDWQALELVQGYGRIADYGVRGDTDETSKGLSIVGDVSPLC